MGFEKCTVSDLRTMLVEAGVCTEEEVGQIKGKANLVFKLVENNVQPPETDEAEETDPIVTVDDIIEQQDDDDEELETTELTTDILPSHPDWKEYVLSQFDESEIFEADGNKYPSLSGLRRVVELILGDIIFSGPVDSKTTHPTPELPLGACTVTYEIQLLWKLGMPNYISLDANLPVKVFRGMAGAHQNNVDGDFALYPEAIAETRAEARALRKALSLSVVSYDEISRKKADDIIKPQETIVSDWNPEDMINDTQKTTITMKCEQFNIDLMKFINSGSKQYDSIDKVTKGTAAAMIKTLSSYQQTNNGSKDIPAALKKG